RSRGSLRLRDTRRILPGDTARCERAEESGSAADCREARARDDRDRCSAETDSKRIVPVYRRAAEPHACFGIAAESRWCSSGLHRRTKSPQRMDAADGSSADWTLCRLMWHGGVSGISGYRLRHHDGPALGRSGASQCGVETWTASLLVKSGSLFERKSPGHFLHVLSRATNSHLARPGVNRVGDAP